MARWLWAARPDVSPRAQNGELDDLIIDYDIVYTEEGCYKDTEHRDLKGDVIHMGADASECTMPCEGAQGQMCGDSWRNNVFTITDIGNQLDIDTEIPVYMELLGCWIDSGDEGGREPVTWGPASATTRAP